MKTYLQSEDINNSIETAQPTHYFNRNISRRFVILANHLYFKSANSVQARGIPLPDLNPLLRLNIQFELPIVENLRHL